MRNDKNFSNPALSYFTPYGIESVTVNARRYASLSTPAQRRSGLSDRRIMSWRHLHLQAINVVRSPVCYFYPVDLFKHLFDTSLTLRARHIAFGDGFGHLAVLGDRPSVYVGAQRPRDQVLFDSLIDAAPPFSITWPKDIRPKFRASFGIIIVAFSTFRHVIIELSAGRDNLPGTRGIS